MHVIAVIAGVACILVALVDAFETILQPRRVTHRFRLARFYYRHTWRVWRAGASLLRPGRTREALLSTFGPLSLLGLFANWILWLIFGFAFLNDGVGTALSGALHHNFYDYLYLSGTTFFTLGYGDVTPAQGFGRTLSVFESGMGFGFLAAVIGYLPVLYQAYSAREVVISQMDARASSPPTAGEILLRLARARRLADNDDLLALWERWAAELLESQLSFPVLSFYRSQHDNQSWLALLAVILDTCAILLAEAGDRDLYQAELTFAMARHAAVDLTLILRTPTRAPAKDRLSADDLAWLRENLQREGVTLRRADDARLAELRATYEPFLQALAQRLLFVLPPVVVRGKAIDNWQRSSQGRAPAIGELTSGNQDHF
ncbi:MAG TPA: potassium channel family protein [Phycisphaerae bacterium]|nr:potassium channel family protein [Phycisphaerae bacterium]